MDTLAHGLTGALIGYAGFRQRAGRPALWAALLGSQFPDADIVLMLIGGETYLRWHRGPTHSLLLLPVWAGLITWVMWELSNRRHGRVLYVTTFVSLLAHVVMDWITSYGTMLLSPLSDRRFELSWVFIVDVYVWALLVTGVVWAAWSNRAIVARAFLLAFCGYVLFCGASREWALRTTPLPPQAARVAAFPTPLNPLRWTIIHEDTTGVVRWIHGTRNDTFESYRDERLMPQAEETEAVKLFRWFAEFPIVERFEQNGFTILRYRDLRFRSPMPGGRVREGLFIVAHAVFDQNGRLLFSRLSGMRG
ncbi:MAG: metal-dependent hydrolase [Verrucomicrobiae bacterium]|nr:metal-dependent hydrolase [Verrucomicrobiae bacterium]